MDGVGAVGLTEDHRSRVVAASIQPAGGPLNHHEDALCTNPDEEGYCRCRRDAVNAALVGLRQAFVTISTAQLQPVGKPAPPMSVMLKGGRSENVEEVLGRAGVTGPPGAVSRPQWLPGSVIVEWPPGELGGVPVRVSWITDDADAAPEPAEAPGQGR
jgi:hypothetical protein